MRARIGLLVAGFALAVPLSAAAQSSTTPGVVDRIEDRVDRREDRVDRRENRADRREDVRDRREDRRDALVDGGVRDRREDVRDRREDRRDRRAKLAGIASSTGAWNQTTQNMNGHAQM